MTNNISSRDLVLSATHHPTAVSVRESGGHQWRRISEPSVRPGAAAGAGGGHLGQEQGQETQQEVDLPENKLWPL